MMLRFNHRALFTGIVAAMAAMAGSSAFAATATADIPISLPILNATCSLSNSNASITLPAAYTTQTRSSYLATNNFTLVLVDGNEVTSADLAQKLSITCDVANTQITSVVVKAGQGSVKWQGRDGLMYLVDSTGAKAFGGDAFVVGAAQEKVNDVVKKLSYQFAGNPTPETTPFLTQTLPDGTHVATVDWFPIFNVSTGPGSTVAGSAANGAFSSSYTAEVSY